MASNRLARYLRWEIIPFLVIKHARLLVVVVILLTGLAVLQLVDIRSGKIMLQVDPSVERLLSPDDESYQYYQSVRRIFGSDETILLLLQTDNVFSPDSMDTLSRLTGRLEKLDGVLRVASLTNALTVRGSEFGIEIESWSDMASNSPEALQSFREYIVSNPVYHGSLVSEDTTATAILISLEDTHGYKFLSQIDNDIRQVIAEEAQDVDIWLTGAPILNLATTQILLDDLFRIPVIVLLVLAFILAVLFRCLQGILIPLSTVAISITWTMAIIVTLGYTLNIVTVLVPTLLMIISLSYSIHVVSEFLEIEQSRDNGTQPAVNALRNIFLPVIFTGLTTAVGFLSLTFSPLAAISEFGILSVIGILLAMLTTLVYTPAMLTLFPPKHDRGKIKGASQGPYFDQLVSRIGQFDARFRMPIISVSVILFCLLLAGMTHIRVGTEYITNFPSNSPVRLAFEKANRLLGGANIFYIVIETGARDAVKEPLNLHTIRELQTWLENQQEIGGTISIVDYLEQLNSAFNENDPAQRRIPGTKKSVAQLLFFGATDEIEQLVDSRYQMANIIVRTTVVNSDEQSTLVNKVNARLRQLPAHLQATVTGKPVLIDAVLDKIIRGQLQSVFAALLIVYCILAGMFLSFKVGLVALIPNIFPIVAYFGVLGYLGISLNPSNSLIAPMVLGIAIDDTVHFFLRFNELMKRQADSRKAAINALRIVGRPVTYTTVALCLGFLVLTGSELKMQEQVGLMACFALAFAWLTDFTLTPALCSNLRIATIWDALTLDLGKRPQETIPLFKGLSNFQARIVARMASIREVNAGERIIEIGQPGREMYAVIDGRLQASIEGKDGRVNLDSHTRGDIVGEAGLFFEKRTANVDAVENSRLLCISQNDLDILRRRYPRIAAKVFHNLNKILATRLVHATDRLI